MAKKDGMFDEVPDAPAGTDGAALGGTHAAPAEQVTEAPAESTDGKEAAEAGEERPNPAKAADRPPGYVPEQSLRESREELKAERRARRELERKYGSLEERTNIILKRLAEEDGQRAPANGQAPKGKGPPNPNENIFGWAESTTERLQRLEQASGQVQQHQQYQQGMAQFERAVATAENQFRQTTPDYDDATNYLRDKFDQQLQLMGFDDPEQRQALVLENAIGLASQAIKVGKSPAELAYTLAKERGYQPRAPQISPSEANNALRPDLDRIARGQEQNRTLSAGAGAPAAGSLDAKALSRMSEEQIHELMKTRSGYAAVNRAMGLG